jgi:peptidoglycan/LPS O-acetylase OafA/YrhL
MRVGLELPFDVHTHLIPTHLRIDSLMTGTLLSWLMHQRFPMFRPRQQTRLFLLLSGVALFIPPFVWDFTQFWWVLPFGASLHAVGASMLILAGFSGQSSGSATMKCMAWIGARSYNIYLWHMPWLFWLNPMLCRHLGIQDNWALCTALYLAGSVILGTLMTTAVERPFLRIRDSIFPSRATPLPATT